MKIRKEGLIDQDELIKIMTYDPMTGIFERIKSTGPNSRKKVGTVNKSTGYMSVNIHRREYKVHRLVWLYIHGEWPKEELDHINGDKLDNRITNLREANRSQNCHNRKLGKGNKSGYKGVYFYPQTQTWKAQIRHQGKLHHLGTFSTAELAHEAYCNSAERLAKEFANFG